ncbi:MULTISPECIES: hypothetical protein [unclassified Leucobacter]|uniref:hypothetical protein n=1 Tax=unclassified Leucobacter TaxID=2621730 RepID=UPI00165D9923|nr:MULTISPECIES: hypothetical protein [unclassified Leucobacter]MBC9935379.1 hypothetical protein [Leucobacter sp. cx-87]
MRVQQQRRLRMRINVAAALTLAGVGALMLSTPAQASAPSITALVSETCLDVHTKSATWNIGAWQAITDGTAVITGGDRAILEYADGSISTPNLPLSTSAVVDANGNALLTVSGLPATATKAVVMFIINGNMIGSVSGTLTKDCAVVPVDLEPVEPVVPAQTEAPMSTSGLVAPQVPHRIEAGAESVHSAQSASVRLLAEAGERNFVPVSVVALMVALGGVGALLVVRRRAPHADTAAE